MKVLLDTCVVIDFLTSREPFFENSKKVLLLCANNDIDGFITAKSLTDIYYFVKKSNNDENETRRIMKELLSIVSLLDTNRGDCLKAFDSNTKDYEDAVMDETAVSYGMDLLLTRNIKDFKNAKVKAMTPNEFLSMM